MRRRQPEVGQRSETVHRANLGAIVRGLHERGAMSRSELGVQTGLTRSTIRVLVGELAAGGLVIEKAAVSQGAPGRPSPLVHLDPAAATVIAGEVFVDSLSAAIVGLGGRVLAIERVDRPRGQLSEDDVVAGLCTLVRRLLVQTRTKPVGVGISMTGVVRRSDGVVSMAPNLGWRDVAFGARLAEALALGVPVAIANDADLGALAEHRRGAAVGVDDLVYVSGEVGVGGGVISGGLPLTGAAGYAGEIGHLPVNPGGSPCRCGSIGCWETEVGEGALLALAGLPPDAGREGVETVLARAAAGDATAGAALDRVGRWLAIGLAGIVNVFNPSLIVLGAMHGRIYPAVRDVVEVELGRRVLAAPGSQVRIVSSTLGIDASLLGAAELALEPLLADPAAFFTHRVRRQNDVDVRPGT